MTALREFHEMLRRHDWWYMMSDDHSVWQRGSSAESRLISISKESDDHRELWDSWRHHKIDGGPEPSQPPEDEERS